MKRTTYLLFVCLFIILVALGGKYMDSRRADQISQTPVVGSLEVSKDGTPTTVDPNILIDDHDKPIAVPAKPVASVVQKPFITAESYLVANLATGESYLSLNPNKIVPIASVSKLYTALVVHHFFDLDKKINITQSMLDSYGDAGHLMLDEKYSPNELLQFLLLVSSNDAAEAFAQSFGPGESTSTDKFLGEMNGFAGEIGMHSTKFKDSSGLSSQNVSTTQDLLALARYLYLAEPEILKISDTKEVDLATTTDHGLHTLKNINPFSADPEFIGGKTGRTTEAKEAMVSLFNKKVGNVVYPIAVIVLRSDLGEREKNTQKLLELFTEKVLKQ